MHRIAFVFHFDEEKSHLMFLHVWRIFFPQYYLNLRTTEEFMPIKLGRAICGRIKDIARLNPKSTDFMFEAADHCSLHISC